MTVLRHGAVTHTGMVRTVNQDTNLVAEPLFAVADGMGGHAAGEVASRVAVDVLRDNARPTAEGLVQAIRIANRAVWEKSEAEPSMRGMGTTLCAVVLVPGADGADDVVVVANVGDSRVYVHHDGALEQITEDHSLVEDLVREGRLTPQEAKHHPQRNVVTRVLGIEEDVQVDTWEVVPYVGDRFLLCSDGLFNEVDEERIAGTLRRLRDPQDAAAELVRLANEAGGRDNITVVVVDVLDDGGRAQAASSQLGAEPASTSSPPPSRPPGRGAADPAGSATASAPGSSPVAVMTPPAPEPAPSRDQAPRPGPRPRRFTWRVALFSLAVLAVLGAAAGAVAWFARSTYFVGVEGDDVVIFQGRPGGVLWFQPTVAEPTDLAFDDVPPSRRPDVQAGKQEATLEGARRYVERLQQQRGAGGTTATTTTTTSVPPPTTPAGDPTTTSTP